MLRAASAHRQPTKQSGVRYIYQPYSLQGCRSRDVCVTARLPTTQGGRLVDQGQVRRTTRTLDRRPATSEQTQHLLFTLTGGIGGYGIGLDISDELRWPDTATVGGVHRATLRSCRDPDATAREQPDAPYRSSRPASVGRTRGPTVQRDR